MTGFRYPPLLRTEIDQNRDISYWFQDWPNTKEFISRAWHLRLGTVSKDKILWSSEMSEKCDMGFISTTAEGAKWLFSREARIPMDVLSEDPIDLKGPKCKCKKPVKSELHYAGIEIDDPIIVCLRCRKPLKDSRRENEE